MEADVRVNSVPVVVELPVSSDTVPDSAVPVSEMVGPDPAPEPAAATGLVLTQVPEAYAVPFQT